jgi:hypothetical protein
MLMFLPGGGTLVENQIPLPNDIRHAETFIDIHARPEVVWQNIIRVRAIHEPIQGFFYRMGFPKPIEATLSKEGVGGVRRASFEGGLVFTETITTWKNLDILSFAIAANPNSTPLTTLDAHVVPGGQYFDVLQGTYRLEPLPGGIIRLHLFSQFRVSTHFNFYSGAWAEFLMTDIQKSILKVLKNRCEALPFG